MIIDLGPLTIKLDVLVVQIINVAILFYLFKKLFGDTLIEEIAKRREMTRKLEQADKEYASLIAQAHVQKDAILDEALAHKKALLAEANELANKQKQQIIAKAEKDAALIAEKAEKEAALKSRDLEQHFALGVKNTAFTLIKKLFHSKKDVQESYLSGLVDEFTTSHKH